MKREELSRQIIAVALAVMKELRPGLDEKLYERAMVIELGELGLGFDLVIRQRRQFGLAARR